MDEKKREICITARLSTGDEWDKWLLTKRLMAKKIGASYLTNRQLISILANDFVAEKNENDL